MANLRFYEKELGKKMIRIEYQYSNMKTRSNTLSPQGQYTLG